MQDVIKTLSSDGGLYRVKQLLHQDFDSFPDAKLETVWTTQLVPFFHLLSHQSVLMSWVIEAQHATLIVFFERSGGNELLESCICVLDNLFARSSHAKINPDLKTVTEAMLSLAENVNRSRSLERHVLAIRTALNLEIPDVKPVRAPVANSNRPTFTIAQDLPGDLSEDGARHDNDSADITEIDILPTIEEILSPRLEYLPRDDPSEWHLPGVEGLIARHFRLLREDSVGPLRDAAKFELERLQNPLDPTIKSKDPHGARTSLYPNIHFEKAIHDDQKGVLFVFAFDQPPHLRNATLETRGKWWQESKRLESDSLVCLLSSDGDATFLVIHSPSFADNKKSSTQKTIDKYTLAGGGNVGYVIAQLTSQDGDEVSYFLRRCFSMRRDQLQHSLIEFPGVILPAFEPTLSALQQMAETLDIPFTDYLLPSGEAGQELPAYASGHNFRWNLQSIVKGSTPGGVEDEGLEEVLQESSLDNAQQRAVLHSLRSQVALVQGPPGTGKSFTGIKLIQALLDNRKTANLGPIICVCYTNHALDQLLEHLIDADVKNIIRIGSRSKSERLADINLRTVAQKMDRTKTERQEYGKARGLMEKASKSITTELTRLSSVNSQDGKALEVLLKERYPGLYEKIFQETDEDGFQTVHHSRRTSPLDRWLHGTAPISLRGETRPLSELESGRVEPQAMTSRERQSLYNSWTEKISDEAYQNLEMQLDLHKDRKDDTDSIRGEVDLRILSKANVIGITTTGLARSIKHLRKLTSKILVVEEAGEVLEAHLLTAMLPSIEHMILIGDHQQLRPKIQNYDLSVENPRSAISLDASLFERLISTSDSIPFVTLETQRRMHPSISELVRSTLYPKLQDAESVKTYPDVIGMRHRLFWMDHDRPEDSQVDQMHSTSHTNTYEVDMVAALVNHLVGQGVYRSKEIAVLTPYLGQLRKLRRKFGDAFTILLNELDTLDLEHDGDEEDVASSKSEAQKPASQIAKGTLLQALRLATVDNFQGEEAKVVIISLVRSNEQRKCGFLRTSNRINVLLSRAMHGMYIIGNSKTSEHIPMWKQVLEILHANGNIGPAIELCCPRHPETPLAITEPNQFAHISPEAGCSLLCGKMLPCGHACQGMCHSDTLHNAKYCPKECTRPRKGCQHPCDQPCGKQCPEICKTVVEDIDIELPCGHHVTQLKCWLYQDPSLVKCKEPVERIVPGCDHKIVQPCHQSTTDPLFQCLESCGASLPCGHICTNNCNTCRPRSGGELVFNEPNHGQCNTPCGRSFNSCSHSCSAPCHGEKPCPLCTAKCESSCVHSDCAKKCHEPCTPCAEESCSSKCPHSACNLPCAAPCDWVPCNKRCEKRLSCSHQCPSLCGEVCPSPQSCQICAPDQVKDMCVDLITMQTYQEVDLDADPCITLNCGHIFTRESLDGLMEMSTHYNLDPSTGDPVAINGELLPLSYDKPKVCPSCRGSLRRVSRYGRIVRRSLLDESTKKFITWSNRTYVPLAERLQTLQASLKATEGNVLLPPGEIRLGGSANFRRALQGPRYRSILRLGHEMFNFSIKVKAEEQPFQRVRDLVEAARRREKADIPEFNFDQTILQTRGQLLAKALLRRTELVIVTDLVSVWENMPAHARSRVTLTLDFADHRKLCDELLQDAQASKNVLQQAEALIFWAQFAALECTMSTGDNTAHVEHLKQEAHPKLDEAQTICDRFPGQTQSVSEEVAGVREMLSDNPISATEMHMVVAAMATEFRGTGHWYRCVNGHPFTIGECGGPVVTSRCPQCGAQIGGQHHMAAEGVTRADDIEREFAGLRV
ncbi:hypothetical protein M409DRAFT_63696 [Zasmidium cellare ATCC 36951]|uniref:RZ-type domain-containing protein n=1 Tax=Zasmidium cellare ATCC 36951 TaxID=1080233 RepID=A0A6A6CWK4_ZASCE|nr:uncharacterized protein M409DRAFT_63696 [Zasmidium cellare ATCC 36951]KAF2171405.1 hypothetical protein M409DRAFT_63696 [Zasmidium cellare ATCC 36951]